MASKPRIYLTAVSCIGGVLQVISPNGNLVYYRQRGIQRLSASARDELVSLGFLHPNWANIPELPPNISLSYEDPVIQGKVRVTFPSVASIMKSLSI